MHRMGNSLGPGTTPFPPQLLLYPRPAVSPNSVTQALPNPVHPSLTVAWVTWIICAIFCPTIQARVTIKESPLTLLFEKGEQIL